MLKRKPKITTKTMQQLTLLRLSHAQRIGWHNGLFRLLDSGRGATRDLFSSALSTSMTFTAGSWTVAPLPPPVKYPCFLSSFFCKMVKQCFDVIEYDQLKLPMPKSWRHCLVVRNYNPADSSVRWRHRRHNIATGLQPGFWCKCCMLYRR